MVKKEQIKVEPNLIIYSTGEKAKDLNLLVDGERIQGVKSLSIEKISCDSLIVATIEVYIKSPNRKGVDWNLTTITDKKGLNTFFVNSKKLQGVQGYNIRNLDPSVEDLLVEIKVKVKQLGI